MALLSPNEIFWKYAPYDRNREMYSVEEIADRIAEWSIYFFSDRHIKSGIVPKFHREIYKDLASNYKYIAITAPSEFSKTTTCSLIYPLYANVYYHEPYTVICTRTDDGAMELLDEIKMELRENDEFKRVYGALLPLPEERGKDRYKKKDSAHLIELTYLDGVTTAIRSIPMRGQVRARKRGGFRVTLLIIDDPEEVDDLDSPTILEKNIRWVDRSAIPRMDKEYGKVRVLGTLIGYNCTIAKLLQRARWIKREYKALMPDDIPIEQRTSVWEERWPTAYLQRELEEFTAEGRRADWFWERMNEPPVYLQKNLKGYHFFKGEFERLNEQNLLRMEGLLDPIVVNTYHAIDPAYSDSSTSDERAQVTFCMGHLPQDWGMKPFIAVLEYDFDFKDPDELIDRALDLHKKYFYSEIIVEANGVQKIHQYIGQKKMMGDKFLINYPTQLRPITYQPHNKENRIYEYFKLIIKLGQLYVRPEQKEIILELDRFMNAPHLHLLDALEMGCRYGIPANDNVKTYNPKSRFARERYADPLEERLQREGREYLLW